MIPYAQWSRSQKSYAKKVIIKDILKGVGVPGSETFETTDNIFAVRRVASDEELKLALTMYPNAPVWPGGSIDANI